MAKTFKDNPALQFISTPTQEEEEKSNNETNKQSGKKAKTKKTEIKYKKDSSLIEVKSKRIQLVWQPSLHKRVKAAAKKAGVSVNEYVHEVLDRATRGENEK